MELAEASGNAHVAELQGLYGPFQFPERILQKIWARGEFDHRHLRSEAGERVTIEFPGHWNHRGGPDFKHARLTIGDRCVAGDVELHLKAEDWQRHGHPADPAFADVVLHVVLFPAKAVTSRSGAGHSIPVLNLLPTLLHALEDYAADDVLEKLAGQSPDDVAAELAPLPTVQLIGLLELHARQRWTQKMHFARWRIQRFGWSEAAHQMAMEVLGLRFNRSAMLRVAMHWPLAEWQMALPNIDDALKWAPWERTGLRPANQPRRRLEQYRSWCSSCPDWPDRLFRGWSAAGGPLPSLDDLRQARRKLDIAKQCEIWTDTVTSGHLGGTRFNTMVVDAWLPLLAARDPTRADWAMAQWLAWPAGDFPAAHARLLRQLAAIDPPTRPHSNGAYQGLLGWLAAKSPR